MRSYFATCLTLASVVGTLCCGDFSGNDWFTTHNRAETLDQSSLALEAYRSEKSDSRFESFFDGKAGGMAKLTLLLPALNTRTRVSIYNPAFRDYKCAREMGRLLEQHIMRNETAFAVPALADFLLVGRKGKDDNHGVPQNFGLDLIDKLAGAAGTGGGADEKGLGWCMTFSEWFEHGPWMPTDGDWLADSGNTKVEVMRETDKDGNVTITTKKQTTTTNKDGSTTTDTTTTVQKWSADGKTYSEKQTRVISTKNADGSQKAWSKDTVYISENKDTGETTIHKTGEDLAGKQVQQQEREEGKPRRK